MYSVGFIDALLVPPCSSVFARLSEMYSMLVVCGISAHRLPCNLCVLKLFSLDREGGGLRSGSLSDSGEFVALELHFVPFFRRPVFTIWFRMTMICSVVDFIIS